MTTFTPWWPLWCRFLPCSVIGISSGFSGPDKQKNKINREESVRSRVVCVCVWVCACACVCVCVVSTSPRGRQAVRAAFHSSHISPMPLPPSFVERGDDWPNHSRHVALF